ncbi:MAG: TcmI family type II polyketide cyclase [Gammaproteobacteria bacterium]|nr:TcmI family type II polyketide cyclase [Gammaproteobacteria bacterium]
MERPRINRSSETSRGLAILRLKPGTEEQVINAFAESDKTDLPWLAGMKRRSIWVLDDLFVHYVESERPMKDVIEHFRTHPLYMDVKSKVDQCVEPLADRRLAREIYRWEAERNCELPQE